MKLASGIALLAGVQASEATCQHSANTKVNVPFHKWRAVRASSKEDCCQKCADDSVCEFSTFHSKVNSCRLKSGAIEATMTEADTYTCQQGASKNIVEVAESVGALSTLVSAVVAADLATTLSGTGPFTVFAPTNDAFAALPAATLESLMKPENKADLVDILTFHVVSGAAYSGDLKHGQKVATLQGGSVTVDTRSGVKINNANVVTADVLASNGVAHVIDAVLVQPEQPKLNIVELAESVGDLSTLVSAVVAGDLVTTLSLPVAGAFTVFAPTNEAFAALPTSTLDSLMKPENKDQLVDILTYHVVDSQVLSTDLKSFQRVKTVQGKNLHVYKDSRRGVRVTPDGRDFKSVTTADVLATNGVVHIIDGVLIPPSSVETTRRISVDLKPYPGYTGDLAVKGQAGAWLSGANAGVWWALNGLEKQNCIKVPEGVGNACGIHIHTGMDCTDATSIGGHYFDSDTVESDPWAPISYNSYFFGNSVGHVDGINIGENQVIEGRALVVHDSTGARVACGEIPATFFTMV